MNLIIYIYIDSDFGYPKRKNILYFCYISIPVFENSLLKSQKKKKKIPENFRVSITIFVKKQI